MNAHIVRFLTLSCLAIFVAGCIPSGDQGLSDKWIQALDRYFGADIKDAQAAMLDMLASIRKAESDVGNEQFIIAIYASTHSRLYLLSRQLGEDGAATNHFQKASDYWQKEYVRRGRPAPGPDEIRAQIEAVDQHLGTPGWSKTE